jgi:hypothetical protein
VRMAEVGRAGQRVDPVNGGDVAADGSLLSVAEIQQRFRDERTRRAPATAPSDAPYPQRASTAPSTQLRAPAAVTSPAAVTDTLATTQAATHSVSVHPDQDAAARSDQPTRAVPGDSPTEAAAATDAAAGGRLQIAPDWIRVIAGHSGAGSSTIALALADAAAASGRRVQVVEAAVPSRSGLVAAASAELGLDPTGAWRRGTRGQHALLGQLTITRRAGDRQPSGWPLDSDGPGSSADGSDPSRGEPMVAIDLGLPPADALARLGGDGSRIVVACRATIPGVRMTEQLLDRLDSAHVVLAMLGQRRWPGEVTSSSGPRLRALRDAGRIVAVPLDQHLAITGPTYAPLPKAVLAAARVLLGRLDTAGPGGTTTAQSTPRRKGTTR